MDDLQLDIAELESLSGQAQRPKVQGFITIQLRKCQTELTKLREASSSKEALPLPTKVSKAPSKGAKRITKYAWDQSDKFMKIYVDLKDIKDLAAENIKTDFTKSSFKVTVENLDNVDYEVHVAYLFGKIVPDKCYYKQKTDMLLVMLKKDEEKTWAFVTEQEGKEKARQDSEKKKQQQQQPEQAAQKDPEGGLMDLMKQMYNDGDDEMKKTIAKAWTQSQDKKPGPPSMDDL